MRHVFPWPAVLLVLATAASASTPGLHLRWNDCSAGASAESLLTFVCDSNTTTFRLVASVVPDSTLLPVTAVDAWVGFATTGNVPVPDWWQAQSGGCHQGYITASASLPGSTSCSSMWALSVSGGYAINWPVPESLSGYPPLTNSELLEVVYAVPPQDAMVLQGGAEYSLFEIRISTRHTTLADPPLCKGCDQAMCIAFNTLHLSHAAPAPDDWYLSQTATAGWRCDATADVAVNNRGFGGYINSCSLGQCPTAARRTTWGQLKSLYR